MELLSIAIVITVLVLQVNGNCEVVVIRDDKREDHASYAAEDLVEDPTEDTTKCCNNTCYSFTDAFDHVTSSMTIHVTTNVKLSSIKPLKNLEYVTIIGHNDPTVTCSNDGGLYFTSCRNCTIEGITWEGCGVAQGRIVEPAIQFHNSSNITIQNCSFRHSIGQAVVLSNMSGHVHINHCKFAENSRYRGHGAAIHHSSNTTALVFTITHCNFSHNNVFGEGKKSAVSVLYIGKSSLCNIILIKDTTFSSNRGSSIFVSMQNVHIDGTVVFENNKAVEGGAIVAVDYSNVTFGKNSKVTFTKNEAKYFIDSYGGAIFLTDFSNVRFEQNSVVVFNSNNAVFGGAVYLGETSSIAFDESSDVTFLNNSGLFDGGAIDCYNYSKIIFRSNSVVSFNGNTARAMMCSTGSTITFEGNAMDTVIYPAITCRGYPCVISYDNTSIFGSKTTYSSCHLGFYYDPESQSCKCFGNDIVFCYGSNSTIRRGYWFGHVDEKSTVTHCPMNYCDFTSCNIVLELCPLSPERTNQCRSRRSGTACGDCEKGYTLPYYSTECINRDNCTALQTTVVILLTVVYWIVLVIGIIVIAYYKVSIGYFYAITYYYSIVDVLLSDYWYIPNRFYIIINTVYSVFKMMPQFLGKLCATEGLSGIDQQFIHYVHPVVVSLILVTMVVLASFSHRLSAIIHKEIVRIICFLLLLSYTLLTFTSMLLLTSLKFFDMDKIYTYVSPDIEYFHGRHLAYGIIALFFLIFVVIGLPLVLITEPLLSQKISFARIKPFLDQFQRCYKHKYHCFAGYYMICRIAMLTIMIVPSSNDLAPRYALVFYCTLIFVIHVAYEPYKSKLLNTFDGMLLLLLALVTVLLRAQIIDSYSIVPMTLALLVLPLIIFLILCSLIVCKDATKNDAILENPNADDDVVDNNMKLNTANSDV